MLVPCDTCSNHYDDSYQEGECQGIGKASAPGSTSSHRSFGQKPVDDHVSQTKAARAHAATRVQSG